MEYIIKSTAILTIFYVFYKMFLQNETFFKSLRSYFLTGIILALTIPLIVITKYTEINPINISSNLIFTDITSINQTEPFNWAGLIIAIYLLGVLFFSIRFLVQLSSLVWFLYTHPKSKKEKYLLVKTTKNIAPFSFFNYIAYNHNQFNETELEQILTHEKVHVNQMHSIDIILSQFMIIFNWFNPFIWFYHKEMQKNLEYTADEFAQNISQEKKKYQYLLLKTISPEYKMALTSNFYNSLIKKRIDMLQKNRSNRIMQFKFALIIPVLIAFILIFNTKIIAQNKITKNAKIVHIDSKVLEIIISKDNTEAELEKIKNDFLKESITVKFKGIKRNSNGEIIAIKINVSSNVSNVNYSTSTDTPIKPIKITFDSDGNRISIGNSNMNHNELVFISNDDKKNNTYFITKNNDENIENHVVKVEGKENHVWISSDEDSTKTHNIMIIEAKGENEKQIWVSKVSDTSKIIEIHENHNDDKKPLIIIDGKEVANKSIEDIDANNIFSINVIKGEKAREKYGNKGENGVIEITTKKE